jgi:hypothetical protein
VALSGLETMNARPRNLEFIFNYWQGLAAGAVPDRALVDPGALKPFLPCLLIAEFETSPFRVRYRMTGTKVDQVTGLSLTGRYLDEFASGRADDAVRALIASYESCWRTGKPYIGSYSWPSERGYQLNVWYGLFPLLVDGEIRQCLAMEDYAELTFDIKPLDWVPVSTGTAGKR